MDDDDWGNEAEWHQVVRLVEREIAMPIGSYEIGSDRFDPYMVDLTVTDPMHLSRIEGLSLAEKIKFFLRSEIPDNWTVRIWLQPISMKNKIFVWLEIDQWRVAEFLGKQYCEVAETLDDFVAIGWGTKSL